MTREIAAGPVPSSGAATLAAASYGRFDDEDDEGLDEADLPLQSEPENF